MQWPYMPWLGDGAALNGVRGTGRDDIFVLILHYFLPKRIFFFGVPAKELIILMWFWFLGLLTYVHSIQVKEMLLGPIRIISNPYSTCPFGLDGDDGFCNSAYCVNHLSQCPFALRTSRR
jgi:hypothetical protein